MVFSWKRVPQGAGLKFLKDRHSGKATPIDVSFMEASFEEYENSLRAAGASENMIALEMDELVDLKHKRFLAQEAAKPKPKTVGENLSDYAEAAIRRAERRKEDEKAAQERS